eukprot:TRINITY_DN83430_c0_g1_i1.p1 TRINITY_DN83430_c0_g1~~TRINITY_DN83430_c0_g1_i1.p1  ORF type:complete len:113 (+),score=3.83 TRINITY_DN83430_c0_g1_i1:136-474(+)
MHVAGPLKTSQLCVPGGDANLEELRRRVSVLLRCMCNNPLVTDSLVSLDMDCHGVVTEVMNVSYDMSHRFFKDDVDFAELRCMMSRLGGRARNKPTARHTLPTAMAPTTRRY